jgi:FkbM family methyltransferase
MHPAIKQLIVGTPVEPLARRVLRAARAGNPLRRSAQDQRRTVAIARKILRRDSNCVDVGSSYGDFLAVFLARAPDGRHFAFEPVPASAQLLRERYPQVQVYEMALSDDTGVGEFHHVVTDPGYSGLRRRSYPRPDFQVEPVPVRIDRLDNVLPADVRIHLLKVDVEGAELQVLRGATRTLRHSRPYVLFEHGAGAADHYGTTPEMMFDLLEDHDMEVRTLAAWLHRRPAMTRDAFVAEFGGHNCNFIASARTASARLAPG